MVEESGMGENSLERFARIRKAVKAAKEFGITDLAQRREAVIDAKSAKRKGLLPDYLNNEGINSIPSVANKNIKEESETVKERAMFKYFEIKLGDPKVPILIDAPHSIRPNDSLTGVVLTRSGLSVNERIRENLDKVEDQNIESYTRAIAEKLSKRLGSSLLSPKKSRLHADANRNWYNLNRKGYLFGDGETIIKDFEYPRSVKAALFWGLEKILLQHSRLDESGKVKDPFCRLSLHGMKDNNGFDFAIAGSRNVADEGFINWFNERLNEAIKGSGLLVSGVVPKSLVARKDDPMTSAYSGVGSLSNFRKDIEGSQHPSFGENFNTIQLEISSRLRKNKVLREKVVEVLEVVLKQVPGYFSSRLNLRAI